MKLSRVKMLYKEEISHYSRLMSRLFKVTLTVIYIMLFPYANAFGQSTTLNDPNIEKLIRFADSTYADRILLYHQGRKIVDWKNESCDLELFNTASMVKSWTSLVVGVLIDKGLINSADDKVCKYLPEWIDGCNNDVTIKNLLTMSAGLNRSGGRGIISKTDMNKHALNVKLDTLPNIRFSYSNESVQLLGIVIEKVTGQLTQEFYQEALFTPLEMKSSTLMKDEIGNYQTYGGAVTTPEDAAKIGTLMLNKGRYKGKQIVSESWINDVVQPSKHASFYGYLWWLDTQSKNRNFAAMGDFGDMTIVFPDLNLVFIRLQDCQTPRGNNMTWMGPHFLELISNVLKD